MIKILCDICKSPDLSVVMQLPQLPITGIFTSRIDKIEPQLFDQKLMFCDSCGHGQLHEIVDPKIVYGSSYLHRSSQSPISVNGNKVFVEFIKKVCGERKFKKTLDVGCNDGHLLSLLGDLVEVKTGIDASIDDRMVNGVSLKNCFVEDYTPTKDIDLVISSHTFEHVERPSEQIKKLIEGVCDDALFFIEVPCLDSMILNSRFDQVFHQHLHYFSVHSLIKLIESAGGEWVDHEFDYSYWGGTLMMAFKKQYSNTSVSVAIKKPTQPALRGSINRFNNQAVILKSFMAQLVQNGEEVVGYGFCQMFPVFDFHTGFSKYSNVIYDDSEDRWNLSYPGDMPICAAPPESLKDKNVVICAPDSSRAILKRCKDLNAKRILTLQQVF